MKKKDGSFVDLTVASSGSSAPARRPSLGPGALTVPLSPTRGTGASVSHGHAGSALSPSRLTRSASMMPVMHRRVRSDAPPSNISLPGPTMPDLLKSHLGPNMGGRHDSGKVRFRVPDGGEIAFKRHMVVKGGHMYHGQFRARLKTIRDLRDPDRWSVSDLSLYLSREGMKKYVEPFFDARIDGKLFLQLDASDLRNDLEIQSIADRKTLLAKIADLKASLQPKKAMPAHGRILTHLSNVRTFHSWLRMAVTCVSLGLIVANLTGEKGPAAWLSGLFFIALGLVTVVYGIIRYFRALHMIEDPDALFLPDVGGPVTLFVMVLVGVIAGFIMILLT